MVPCKALRALGPWGGLQQSITDCCGCVMQVDEDLEAWTEGARALPLVLTIAMDTRESPQPPDGVSIPCRMESYDTFGGTPPIKAPGDGPRYQVLERWVLRHDPDAGQPVNATSAVKQLLLLVRSVHSCLRLLPCHGTVMQVRPQPPARPR